MDSLPRAPILGLIASAAGPVLRILRDRFAPPTRGLRYFDLEVKPDDALTDQIAGAGAGPASKPYTHFLKITNSGREVIDQRDYIRPFTVRYGTGVQVVGYRIVRDDPAIQPTVYRDGADSSGILLREILNPGDSLTVGILLAASSEPGRPAIDCRIRGVRHIKGHIRGTPWLPVLGRLAAHYFAVPLAAIAGLVIGYGIYLAANAANPPVFDALTFLASGFGMGLLWGILIGGALAVAVETWEVFSFRSQRRSIEDSFRAAVRARLDTPRSLADS